MGHTGPLDREPIRFIHDPSLAFPSGDVSRVRETSDGRTEVTSTFLGLVGVSSPLPTYFSEDLIDAEVSDNQSLRAFYDVLHHRLYALFYRAGLKYRAMASARADGQDAFTRHALAFVGADADALPLRGLPASRLLGLAPLLATQTRSSRGLQVFLEQALEGVPVAIESFISRSVPLVEGQRNALAGANSVLGETLTLGGRVEDRSGRFRTRLGPVDRATFEALLPGGAHHDHLRHVVEQFTGGVLEAEVEVILAEGASGVSLGDPSSAKLGVNTVLGARPDGEPRATRARFTLDADPSKVHARMFTGDRPPA
jgi:type VI secretion system protein ImpH